MYEDDDFVVVYKPPGMKAIDDGTKKKQESLQSVVERQTGSRPFLVPITEAPRLVEQNGCSGIRVLAKTERAKEVCQKPDPCPE